MNADLSYYNIYMKQYIIVKIMPRMHLVQHIPIFGKFFSSSSGIPSSAANF